MGNKVYKEKVAGCRVVDYNQAMDIIKTTVKDFDFCFKKL